jgi:hypothetical protein
VSSQDLDLSYGLSGPEHHRSSDHGGRVWKRFSTSRCPLSSYPSLPFPDRPVRSRMARVTDEVLDHSLTATALFKPSLTDRNSASFRSSP